MQSDGVSTTRKLRFERPMSAIAGIVRWDGVPLPHAALDRAMSALAHYGENGGRISRDGHHLIFGHHLMAYTPESAGEHQPLVRGKLAITADVRLDNRSDLAGAFALSPAVAARWSDSEFILEAYRKWGEECAGHLLGDFAFALWDGDRQRLYAARDHIGARPFYYWGDSGGIAFSSEIGGVLACDGVRREIDEAEVARLLLCPYPYLESEYTFFRGLRKLPFGHWLSRDARGTRVHRHWYPENAPEVRMRTLDDYAERLRELLTTAVSDRLRTRLTVGAHLSGGLDSSSVAVTAARLLRARGAAAPAMFSHSPPPAATAAEEHERIGRVCEQESLAAIYIDPAIDTDSYIRGTDISLVPVKTMEREQWVQRAAAARGVGVILTGWGGDEGVSFNGRGLGFGSLVSGQWSELAGFLELSDLVREPKRWRTVVRRFYRQVARPIPKAIFPSLWGPAFERERGFILPEFARRIRSTLRPFDPPPRESAGARAYRLALLQHGHLSARMESWTAFGAKHRITYVHPLADRRLLEFSLGVPTNLHFRDDYGRYLFRYAMQPVLPKGMTWTRVKLDPALEKRTEELQAGEWRRLRELLAHTGESRSSRWVDLSRLRQKIGAIESGRTRPSGALFNALACLPMNDGYIRSEKTCEKHSNS